MKIFRAYIITAITCISITALAASVFIADENARKTTLGEEFAVVVMSDYQSTDFSTFTITEKVKEAIKKAAGIAPPPIYELISKTL